MRPLLFLAVLALAACDSDAEHEDGAGAAGSPAGPGGGGSGGSPGGGGEGGGAAGGGTCTPDGAGCDAQEVCVFTDGTCGEADPDPHCAFYPPTCGESPLQTVCGCDGKTRAANCVIGDVDTRPGACPPPEGQFWCGALACDQGQQYCRLENEAFCDPLPAACLEPGADCSCLEPISGTCMCDQKDDGHLEVSCYTI